MDPYHLLLWDAMNGDPSRFARYDYVMEAWRIVDPVLQSSGPVYEYTGGSWGPAEAGRLLDGRTWHDPKVDITAATGHAAPQIEPQLELIR
jgi:glucose-6-phosphate 1-dehydrogenase